jgi:hypothetical protein
MSGHMLKENEARRSGRSRPDVLAEMTTNSAMFWDIAPCSLVENGRGEECAVSLLAASVLLANYILYSSTLRISATYTAETFVNFYETTRRHILQDGTIRES